MFKLNHALTMVQESELWYKRVRAEWNPLLHAWISATFEFFKPLAFYNSALKDEVFNGR